ncbi:MAG: 16S rRNA (cytidine(1402)-2'-O)-methyltransferase [Fastidiosipilaceae bacterium]|nr:16S rRNA (cytidine(1402)-2'-O)-methyltransferase [Clostridiaceae bacterium]
MHLNVVDEKGCLYVVGTPIGNLEDFSPRARRILQEVDLVAAEDTRISGRLLRHFGIDSPLLSFHEHNVAQRLPGLLARLKGGARIALVSDAGMPCISDPGVEFVRACREANIKVVVIPGPTAAVTALVGSGFPSERFLFIGFLPAKGKSRREALAKLRTYDGLTVILYEAPHRLRKTLGDLAELGLGSVEIALARELTKRYETYILTTVDEAIRYYETTDPRGEYVLLVDMSGVGQAGEAGSDCDGTLASVIDDSATSNLGSWSLTQAYGGKVSKVEDQLSLTHQRIALATRFILEGMSTKDVVVAIQKWEAERDSVTKRNVLYEWIQSLKDFLYTEEGSEGEV